jgi:hypothetical protein
VLKPDDVASWSWIRPIGFDNQRAIRPGICQMDEGFQALVRAAGMLTLASLIVSACVSSDQTMSRSTGAPWVRDLNVAPPSREPVDAGTARLRGDLNASGETVGKAAR